MSEDPALEQELREALHERAEIRLDQLREERERFAARLERLDQQISDLEGAREAQIERDMQRIRRSLNATPRPVRPRESDAPRSQPKTNPTESTGKG